MDDLRIFRIGLLALVMRLASVRPAHRARCSLVALLFAVLLFNYSGVHGAEATTVEIEFRHQGDVKTSHGEVLGEYADGSLLLLTPDGQLWTLLSDEIVSLEQSNVPLEVLSSEEIYAQFQEQLPQGFGVYKTRHYVLVYNTSEAYVQWVAELFESLYRRFYNYWKTKGVRLEEPRFPLVAVVFSNKASYLTYAEREIGETARSMIGYYNMKTNRMVSYDLTGIDGLLPAGTRVPNSRVIQQILSRPQAERTVATIVHEAVHQLSFNSGLQVRLAGNPLWLSEGMAMFFESPDQSAKGWGAIGRVNVHNLRLFLQYLPQRSENSLETLIVDDARFRDAATAVHAYPESWALTYFLLRTKSREYVAYLQELAELEPFTEVTGRERLDTFKQHFGSDLQKLDREFVNYIRHLR